QRYRSYEWLVSSNRGVILESLANNAFDRKTRAPCDRKNLRSSGVKKEEPFGRGLKSRSNRPFSFKKRLRMSLIKNSQSAGDHSSSSSTGPIRRKQMRCAATK